ncbi:hypothetical protein DPEC_G00008990 [Dallia pectoralis]|uniref:Uncharacterized protein n=1 Tax=Dallia pectoralis TaxID=75939 RepID=A0ACC2HKZ5_DALPE|nr:hypothetical protein DPEC_G00008990 [Dallia pectoralis]
MQAFSHLLLEYPQLMYGGVGATAFIAGGTLIYKIATRRKPSHVNVNCWFCNLDSVVPYGNRNCWDCPNCEQYNGFQENGDYNKPIPAQFSEHLNHCVSASLPLPETPRTLQWVNCQMLLCKKCNNNQTIKIKQLASFIPREDENYDDEIEVYKHHVEQTYKLCRPCQTAVEYYIKHQNRQLRAVLFNHQLRRSKDSDKAFVKSSYSFSTPVGVIFLRVLAFLTCAFLVSTATYGFENKTQSAPQTLSGGIIPPKPTPSNESTPNNGSSEAEQAWQNFLELLPEESVENAKLVWQYGRNYQIAVVSIGLLTCITGVFLGGPIRLRRIDAVASVLWFLVLGLYLVEKYLKADVSSWLDTVKLCTISLCCLVGFAAAVTTRKSMDMRRARGRRYLSGNSEDLQYGDHAPLLSQMSPGSSSNFFPTPPPNLSQLINRHKSPRERRASPSSLPGRLNRALYLGTIPSLARTDSGYLFSGSRPPSQCKDSLPSVTSISSSRQRRPLISPARLNISGQKLGLFISDAESQLPPTSTTPHQFSAEPAPFNTRSFNLPDMSPYQSYNDVSSLLKEGSVISEELEKKREAPRALLLVLLTPPQTAQLDGRGSVEAGLAEDGEARRSLGLLSVNELGRFGGWCWEELEEPGTFEKEEEHGLHTASPQVRTGRLNRALYLGTIPSLARTDSGYLFSGSRPPSQCKDSLPSDYFSFKSGSRPSSPCPSPTPSVADSVTSISSSRQRRPLISPARLNISGQKLGLFISDAESQLPPTSTTPHQFSAEPAPFNTRSFNLPDMSPYQSYNDVSSLLKEGSVISEELEKKRGSSSSSSACIVDTTTDCTAGWKGILGRFLWPGLLLASLGVNLFFSFLYLYRS